MAHKIAYPKSVTLLRGNHESRLMCSYMTFSTECTISMQFSLTFGKGEHKYDSEVYEAVMKFFDCLPLAAVLEGGAFGTSLCMHGGIGPDIKTVTYLLALPCINVAKIDDIVQINRFMEPPPEGPLWCSSFSFTILTLQ